MRTTVAFVAGVLCGYAVGASLGEDGGAVVRRFGRRLERVGDGSRLEGATFDTTPPTREEAASVRHTRTDGM